MDSLKPETSILTVLEGAEYFTVGTNLEVEILDIRWWMRLYYWLYYWSSKDYPRPTITTNYPVLATTKTTITIGKPL